jgi:hypothetical protein
MKLAKRKRKKIHAMFHKLQHRALETEQPEPTNIRG